VNRSIFIALAALVAAVSSAATVLAINVRDARQPAPTEEQRAAREMFFGSSKELPPIKDGQEMRPRW
jgi:Ti type entry exclusion protein TrbK